MKKRERRKKKQPYTAQEILNSVHDYLKNAKNCKEISIKETGCLNEALKLSQSHLSKKDSICLKNIGSNVTLPKFSETKLIIKFTECSVLKDPFMIAGGKILILPIC